ncbi:MAG TPA: glycoside hydrolase family 76 protein, partial [Ktedonobacteraceae bacterium]|nr:glycoside hydrolase family 76 protein [Ktedonobacteraceae bacterium]
AKYFYYDTTHTKYNDFWMEAISWDIVMDAYQRNPHNLTYRRMIDDVYNGFMAHNDPINQGVSTACNTSLPFELVNNYNDDIGWWAKASMRAFNITREKHYLNCAKRLFDLIYASWDTSSYGGGIWWTRPSQDGSSQPTQKNVATNAPAVITAVGLAAALSDRSYLTKAESIYDWMKSKLTDGSGMVYDNYDSGALRMWQFTYNYGTFIGAADTLYKATKNSSYLTDAKNVANKSLSNVTTHGILKDEGLGDGGGFKGIYVRYLAELATTYHQSQYLRFFQMNAAVAWTNRRKSDNLVGNNWAATPAPTDTIQTHVAGSAVAILQFVSLK